MAMAWRFAVSMVTLFLSSHVTTCLHDNKEQIFAQIIENYDENSNNVRTFCAGGACPGGESGEGGRGTPGKEKRAGEPRMVAVKGEEGSEWKGRVRKVQREEREVTPGDPQVCARNGGDGGHGDPEVCPGEEEGDAPPERDVGVPLRPHTVDVHKYQARHQRTHLFSKATDEALGRVRLPTSVRKVRRAMKRCALEISKTTITPEVADNRAASAPKHEALRQNLRTMEDRHRMEERLESWPPNKTKGAIYLIVTAARSDLLKGEYFWRTSVLFGGSLCFGLLVTSALGFKARTDPLPCILCGMCAMNF